MTTYIQEKTFTLTDIRNDLAHELMLMRKYRRRYPEHESQVFYKTVMDYISELGHGLYERTERKR